MYELGSSLATQVNFWRDKLLMLPPSPAARRRSPRPRAKLQHDDPPRTQNTAGTTNNVNNVPIESPEAMTTPIWNRDTAPAPVAVISGNTPSTMAAVVIKIGRSLIQPPLHSLSLQTAFLLQMIGELYDQYPVLADQAHESNKPDFGIDVERHAAEAETDEDQRAGNRHRHRHQDDDRITETLEQSSKREENDDQRKAERGDEAAALLDVRPT